MKLYDYLITLEEGTELTVWDIDYDTESYFYNDDPEDDEWQDSILELAKVLEVREIKERGVVVNLSELIESKIDLLKETDLFHKYTVDSVMSSIEGIISGYVSEEWFNRFVDVLKR